MKHLLIGSVFAAVAALAPAGYAAINVKVNYDLLDVSYSAGSLSLGDNANSIANAFLLDTSTSSMVPGSQAMILGSTLDVSIATTVVNPAGNDNISVAGLYRGADVNSTLANPSLMADVSNNAAGGDADGLVWDPASRMLTIVTLLSASGANDSILLNPLVGNFLYQGQVGSFTVPAADRGLYDQGVLTVIQFALASFGDASPIASADADALFADADLHGGFSAHSAQVQITVLPIPEPGTALLALASLSILGRPRRRLV
jgi:hypothetical protein